MNFTVYSKPGCPYCDKVKNVLSDFDLIVTSNPDIIINYENVIKFDTVYNKSVNCKKTITSIKELKLEI